MRKKRKKSDFNHEFIDDEYLILAFLSNERYLLCIFTIIKTWELYVALLSLNLSTCSSQQNKSRTSHCKNAKYSQICIKLHLSG